MNPKTFSNPVFRHSFPDPFILKFCGEYFGYCTGHWDDGSIFGVIRSRDLVNWKVCGGAMAPLENGSPFYWAPEVTYSDGVFYLYYSVGNETLMEIRVATSNRPDGGFIDSGKGLTPQDFAIDPHVFVDDDGERYLFYATDFLQYTHIGTGTVVDRLTDWLTLAGDPQPVTRAKYDWQVYDPLRKEKGGVRWYTVEGPFVLKRKGRYYEMFSGGNWQNPTYGVSFAASDRICRDTEWDQYSDGEKSLPILRTIPGKVIGPGHNSVIEGPNDRELFCIYHEWVDGQRVLAIDRMDLIDKRIFVNGASSSPQPEPFKANITLEDPGQWEIGNGWNVANGRARTDADQTGVLGLSSLSNNFWCNLDFRLVDDGQGTKTPFSIHLRSGGNAAAAFWFDFVQGSVRFDSFLEADVETQTLRLPAKSDAGSFHHIRLEYSAGLLRMFLDKTLLRIEKNIRKDMDNISLDANGAKVEVGYFALTNGFEDLFEYQSDDPAANGWNVQGTADLKIDDKQLVITNSDGCETAIVKGPLGNNLEFAANLRCVDLLAKGGSFGFLIMNEHLEPIRRFIVDGTDKCLTDLSSDHRMFLGQTYLTDVYRQFRFVRLGSLLRIESEDMLLGEIQFEGGEIVFGILCANCTVALDMVRYTEI